MGTTWTQPTLGGPSVRSFVICASFRWPLGWRAYLDVQMEGESRIARLVSASELTTDQLQAWLETIEPLLHSLMFNDELPDEGAGTTSRTS